MSPNLSAIGQHIPGAAILYVPEGETIFIGDVQVHIGRTVAGRAALSIWAPPELPIDRASRVITRNDSQEGLP